MWPAAVAEVWPAAVAEVWPLAVAVRYGLWLRGVACGCLVWPVAVAVRCVSIRWK